ncbi:MAG: glycosyltransferase family 4 protein [Candidatus Omnitrophica bacterium]|nr:glycosyltransferase family 4 protein [Candidatus Omnitrophota bacterium]
MDKKRLLIVTSTFPGSRTDIISARFVYDLAVSLAAYYDLHVLAPSSADSADFESIDGVKIHRFSYFLPKRFQGLATGEGILANIRENKLLAFQIPFFLLSQFFNLVRIVRKERIEIVNSHWIIPQGLITAMFKRLLGIRHILTIHAAGIFALKRWGNVGRRLARYTVRRSDVVMPVSSYIKETLDNLVDKTYNFKTVPMGVNLRSFSRSGDTQAEKDKTNKGLRVLFVGKMVEKKGLRYFLDALSIIKKRGCIFKLDVAGGGLLEKSLKEYSDGLGLNGEVSFHGWVANEKLPELYSKSDIVAVPSVFNRKGETEGMPVVVLEAMAMSRPILASRISGIPDIVKDGYNGWLTEPGNPEDIAKKLEAVCDLDLLPYGMNAFETAKGFSYERIASMYKEMIG